MRDGAWRRRVSRAVRLAKFNDSPSFAVSALSKQRAPKSTIRYSLSTAQPTDAIPISKPKVNFPELLLLFMLLFPIIRSVVAIRGESRCYNKGLRDSLGSVSKPSLALGFLLYNALLYKNRQKTHPFLQAFTATCCVLMLGLVLRSTLTPANCVSFSPIISYYHLIPSQSSLQSPIAFCQVFGYYFFKSYAIKSK